MHPYRGLEFGGLRSDLECIERPGSYALTVREGRLLTVEEGSGLFLPGGGHHDGESPEEALERELLEETGFALESAGEIAVVDELFRYRPTLGMRKRCHLYRVELGERERPASKTDCTARWLTLRSAREQLHHDAFQWAASRFVFAVDGLTVELRPATDDDYERLYRLHRETMRPSVERTWGWDEEFQREYFRDKWDPRGKHIVLADSAFAGVFHVVDREEALFVELLEISRQFQSRGIGTRLLESVIAESTRRDQPVELHVLRENPGARRLYERLGFEVTGSRDERLHLRRRG